jgi:hypothetical protein
MSVSERAPRRRGGCAHRVRTLVLLAPPSPSSPPISFAPRDQVIARCPGCAHVFWTVNTRQRFCCLACADGGPTDD